MDEKIAAYIKKIEGKLGGKDPMKVQSTTAKELARLMKGTTPAKLKKRPAPDKWSAAEIITHLADSEIAVGWRMRAILGAPGTPIQAWNPDAWAAAGHYSKRDPRETLEAFRVVRETNLAMLKTLTPEQWKHFGIHAERGEESIERLVQMMAGHDINHTEQIEQLLRRKK